MGKARKEEQIIEEPKKAESKKEVVYEIHTPNKSYTGLNCAVEFVNGVGRTKVKVLAEHFINKGYEVKEV